MISGEPSVCDHVDRDTEQLFGDDGELGDRQQSHVRCARDKDIEVALFRVTAEGDRAEHSGVTRAMSLHDSKNRLPM